MMGTRSLAWAAAVIGVVMALMHAGCSDRAPDSHTEAQASTGTVRVALGSRLGGSSVLSDAKLTLAHLDLLGVVGNEAALPSAGGASLTTVPVLNAPSVLPMVSWASFGATSPTLTADLPAGLYSQVSLVADPSMAGLIDDLDLPFDTKTYVAVLPIDGTLNLQPGQQVTLFVDLVKGKALAAATTDGSTGLPFVPAGL
jgi:hypothetical protein